MTTKSPIFTSLQQIKQTHQTNMSQHIAAFAFPFGSHPTTLLHLIHRLAVSSPNTRFSFFNTKTLFSNDYYNVVHYDVHDGMPENHENGGVQTNDPMKAIELFVNATPENFTRRLHQVVEETGVKVTCLVTDAFLWFSKDVAEELGVPWVAFWTAGPTALSLHLYTDVINQRLGDKDQSENLDQRLDFVPGMSAIHAKDLPIEFRNLDMPLSRLLHNMSLAVPHASAVVLNSFDSIDSVVENDLKSKLNTILNIGPFPLASPIMSSEDQSGCLTWLDSKAASSVAYISFGTMLMPSQQELVALAEALEEKKVPYLWSFRDSSKLDLLKGFLERTRSIGKVVEWTPQLQVLRHSSVGVFLTHCGWNSVMESIMCGVPMICRPFFGDQMINKRLVEDVWQIGVGVEGGVLGKSSVVNALDRVLVNDDRKEIRKQIDKLKECASKSVAENGSSTTNFKSLVELVTRHRN